MFDKLNNITKIEYTKELSKVFYNYNTIMWYMKKKCIKLYFTIIIMTQWSL